MTSAQIAKYLIQQGRHMTIATADASGKPWISTVGFAYDNNYSLYWVSHKDALHSKNIRLRPHVGIVIFGPVPPDSNIDGIYFDAKAFELKNEEDIKEAIPIMAKSEKSEKFKIHSINDVMDKASWRIYRAIPIEITKRVSATDPITGQAITIRELIDLS